MRAEKVKIEVDFSGHLGYNADEAENGRIGRDLPDSGEKKRLYLLFPEFTISYASENV